MGKRDGRKLSHETLEEIRIHAVRAVVEGKQSAERVIETLGFGRSVIYGWLKKYREGGLKALKSRESKGLERIIGEREEKQLQKLLQKDPRQLHFDFGLWTLKLVQTLIRKKFGKDISLPTTWRVLQRIGYSCQKPLQRAYEQNPEAVKKWTQEEYREIKKEAKEEERIILFSDESGFRSTGAKGKTWGIQGTRPIVKKTGKRYGVNSISALSPQGHFRFSLYEGSFNGEVFLSFLKRLLATIKGNLTLIVDGHPVHKQKKVREFILSTEGRLKMYFLPPYSPELNPDEHVWQYSKPLVHKQFPKTKKDFIAKVRSSLHSMQKNISLLCSLFLHPSVSYVLKI